MNGDWLKRVGSGGCEGDGLVAKIKKELSVL